MEVPQKLNYLKEKSNHALQGIPLNLILAHGFFRQAEFFNVKCKSIALFCISLFLNIKYPDNLGPFYTHLKCCLCTIHCKSGT